MTSTRTGGAKAVIEEACDCKQEKINKSKADKAIIFLNVISISFVVVVDVVVVDGVGLGF